MMMIAKRVKIIVLFVIVLLSISGCSKDDDNLNTIQDQFVGTWYSEKYYYDKDSGLLYPLGDIYDYPVTGITFLKNGTFSSYGLLPYTEGKYTVEVKKDANTGGEYFNIYLYKNNKVVNTIYGFFRYYRCSPKEEILEQWHATIDGFDGNLIFSKSK